MEQQPQPTEKDIRERYSFIRSAFIVNKVMSGEEAPYCEHTKKVPYGIGYEEVLKFIAKTEFVDGESIVDALMLYSAHYSKDYAEVVKTFIENAKGYYGDELFDFVNELRDTEDSVYFGEKARKMRSDLWVRIRQSERDAQNALVDVNLAILKCDAVGHSCAKQRLAEALGANTALVYAWTALCFGPKTENVHLSSELALKQAKEELAKENKK